MIQNNIYSKYDDFLKAKRPFQSNEVENISSVFNRIQPNLFIENTASIRPNIEINLRFCDGRNLGDISVVLNFLL